LFPTNRNLNGSGGSGMTSKEIFPLLQHSPNFGDLSELDAICSSTQWRAWQNGHSAVKDPRLCHGNYVESVEGGMADMPAAELLAKRKWGIDACALLHE
jgi:hypothetical protein